jgi:hypothetical protein
MPIRTRGNSCGIPHDIHFTTASNDTKLTQWMATWWRRDAITDRTPLWPLLTQHTKNTCDALPDRTWLYTQHAVNICGFTLTLHCQTASVNTHPTFAPGLDAKGDHAMARGCDCHHVCCNSPSWATQNAAGLKCCSAANTGPPDSLMKPCGLHRMSSIDTSQPSRITAVDGLRVVALFAAGDAFCGAASDGSKELSGAVADATSHFTLRMLDQSCM